MTRPERSPRASDLLAHPVAGRGQVERNEQPAVAVGHRALTDDERETFTRLNSEYVAKHGFPFIIAVRDHTKASILDAFGRRIGNDRATEFSEACHQVERIAEFRLKDILP